MAYSNTYLIRFADVDHAQILYFPNFLHYFHCCFEDFFENAVNFHYKRVLSEHRIGFPSVHLDVDFKSPLRFGDHVEITLTVNRIGTKSVSFDYVGKRTETQVECVRATIVTAVMNMDTYRAIELPTQYRDWFSEHLSKPDAADASE